MCRGQPSVDYRAGMPIVVAKFDSSTNWATQLEPDAVASLTVLLLSHRYHRHFRLLAEQWIASCTPVFIGNIFVE